jgi:hypothetical protein
MKIKTILLLAFSLLIVAPVFKVNAIEGGYSNYVPGFYGDFALAVAPADGLHFKNDIYHYSADGGASSRSGQVEANVDISFTYDYFTLFHKPGVKLFGADYAYGATQAVGNVDLEANLRVGNTTVSRAEEYTGLGDLTLIPGQFYWNSGNFHFAWGNYIVVPIGDYDVNDSANSGLNYWTFETDFMATYFNPENGRDYSIVVGYGYNTENDDTNYQSGDEFHIDYVFNQFFSESFAIGINGFYYKQLSGDSGSGAVLGDFKAEAAGIGPSILWNTSLGGQDVAFIAKWIHEFHSENRLEGDHVFASFALSF